MGFESPINLNIAPAESEVKRSFREKMLNDGMPKQNEAMNSLLDNTGAQADWLDSLNLKEQEEVRKMVDELVEQSDKAAMPEVLARKRQIFGKFKVLINIAVDRSLEQAA